MNPRLEFLLSLTDRISDPLARIQARFRNLQNMASEGWGKLKGGAAGMAASMYAAANALEPAREVAARLGEVASLDVPIEELMRLEKTALLSATQYGVAADQFIGASYHIQSAMGAMLKEGELGGITDIASTLAVGTKAQIDTMTDYVGKMNGIFKQESALAGAENWTKELAAMTASAVKKFTTDGQKMSDAFSRLGASAQSSGIDISEQIAVLGKLQTTMSGSEAATKYQAFLNGAGKAQEKLGLSFVDSQGKMLGIVDILGKIQEKYGDLSKLADSDLIQKAFGTKEASLLIKLLGSDIQSLNADINEIGSARDFSAVEKMASAIADPFDKAGEAVKSITAQLGGLFLPQVNAVMDKVAQAGAKILSWIDANPALAKTLTKVGIAVGAFVLGVSALAIVMGSAMLAAAGFGMVMGVIFSPVILIIAAVAALAAGAYYLYTRWDTLVGYLKNTVWGSALLSVLSGIADVIKTVLMVAFAALVFKVEGVIAIASKLWQGWNDLLEALGDTYFGQLIIDTFALLMSPLDSAMALFDFLGSAWDRVKNSLSDTTWGKALLDTIDMLMKPLTALIDGFNKAKNFAAEKISGITDYASAKLDQAGSFVSGAASSAYNSVVEMTPWGGARALGGPVLPQHFYEVNERGPEMFQTGGRSYLMTGGTSGNIIPFPTSSAVQQSNTPAKLNMKAMMGRSASTSPRAQANGKHISIQEVHIHSSGKMDPSELKMMLEQAYGG